MWALALYLQNTHYFYFALTCTKDPQNVQSQIKGKPVAACSMTSEFRNEAGIFGAGDVSDISDIKRHRWDMEHETTWTVKC